MSEPRDKQVVVNIEATLHEAVTLASTKLNLTASTYVRGLIIDDLVNRGMLSERTLAQVLK